MKKITKAEKELAVSLIDMAIGILDPQNKLSDPAVLKLAEACLLVKDPIEYAELMK